VETFSLHQCAEQVGTVKPLMLVMDWLECDDSWRIDEAESEHGGWFKL